MKIPIEISVVIPTFNRKKTIERAIQSVLDQTLKPLEVIVVDDGSTDGTQGIVKKYDIQYFRFQENSGVSRARNFGISQTKGNWIALLDSDDEWLPKKLEKQVALIKETSTLVHGEEIWIKNGSLLVQKAKHAKSGGFIFENTLPLCVISPSASLFKKDVFHGLGGFDESYFACEDYDLWLRWTSLYPVDFVESPVIKKYGGHNDQLSAKYHSMDFWRIQSMHRIKSLRNFDAPTLETINENIIKKSEILISGCLKHGNHSMAAAVARWYHQACAENHRPPGFTESEKDFLTTWEPGPISPQARLYATN